MVEFTDCPALDVGPRAWQIGGWKEAQQILETNDIPAPCRVLVEEAVIGETEEPKRREYLEKLCARVRRDSVYIID